MHIYARHLERLYGMKSITIYSRAPGTPGEIRRPYPSDPVAARARRDAELKARIAQRSAETEAWIAQMMARVNAPWSPVGSGGSEEGRRARAERLELQRLADMRRREASAGSTFGRSSSGSSARRTLATGPVVRFRRGDVTPAGDVVREVRADGAVTYGRASHVRQWSVSSRPVVRIGVGR